MNELEDLWHCQPYARHELHVAQAYEIGGRHFLRYQCTCCNFTLLVDRDLWWRVPLPPEDIAA